MADGCIGGEQNYEYSGEKGVWSWRNTTYWTDGKPWVSHWSKYEQRIIACAPSLSSLTPITKQPNSEISLLSITALKDSNNVDIMISDLLHGIHLLYHTVSN